MRARLLTVLLTVIVVASFALYGCSSTSKDSQSSTSSSNEEQVKVIVDAYGRSVKVPANAQTAATVGSATRIVVYAGAQDKLIGVTDMEKTPNIGKPYTIAFESLFASLPSTNNGNHILPIEIDTDALINLHPDVIISSRGADECEALEEKTGIPVIGVFYQNQLFTTNVINSIECVAEALGTESHAQGVIAKLQEWQTDLSNRTANIPDPDKPSVYFGGVSYLESRSWEGTYANYGPARVAHINNVANEIASDGYVNVSLDQIVEWNPDYIFLNENGDNRLEESMAESPAEFAKLTAIQTGNVYTQPFYNFNGTNVDTGICEAFFVGATVYPEAFSGVDLDALYTDIYKTLLGGYDFYAYMVQHGRGFMHYPGF